MSDAEQQEFRVGGPEVGARLDVFLGQKLAIGRAHVKKLLGAGRVTLNGHVVAEKGKGLFLREGSVVAIAGFARPGSEAVTPRDDVPLHILAEGDGWVIVDKPAGVAVHPLAAQETDTLLNAVVARYPQLQGVGEGGLKSGVVHRLDVDTSGAVLFATQQRRWEQLREAFTSHTARKTYRAIVDGEMTGTGREIMDLVVVRHAPARVAVVNPTQGYRPPGARECHLSWRVIQKLKGATLVEVELGTGFLHQIRVMMAHLGHPVLGDPIYGEPEAGVPRQMLHAAYLRAGPAEARSPDPEDFVRMLKRL